LDGHVAVERRAVPALVLVDDERRVVAEHDVVVAAPDFRVGLNAAERVPAAILEEAAVECAGLARQFAVREHRERPVRFRLPVDGHLDHVLAGLDGLVERRPLHVRRPARDERATGLGVRPIGVERDRVGPAPAEPDQHLEASPRDGEVRRPGVPDVDVDRPTSRHGVVSD
jgi:hypothetical protein